ncbi:TPA: hypothetical protein ACNRXC_004597 [Escherichia coli]
MNSELELLIKILFPSLSAIISLLGLKTGWTYKKDKLFTSRKNISEFSYQMYKSSEDPTFKKLAEDYGIAALTKDNTLTKKQRLILLNTTNPVSDIDDYSKCQSLISITTHKEIFAWNKKRYKYSIYRKLIKIITTLIYFMGSLVVALPFSYSVVVSAKMMEKINHLTTWQYFGLSSYFVVSGVAICFICLDKPSKIKIAERLIVSNRRLGDKCSGGTLAAES